MQFKCDFFDINKRNLSRNIHNKSLKHKKCLREKYIINHPNFFEVDTILSDYVERNKKKFDLYLFNCEYKLELKNNFNPQIKKEYLYNTSIICAKIFLLYWIEYFMSKGYKFCQVNEMIIQTISNRRNMTYESFINQPMSMCERKINLKIAKNPH